MKTIVIGDIHGNYLGLQQMLSRANYNVSIDRLICIGDYVDGHIDSYKVVQTLIEYQDISGGRNIYIMGNHDEWYKNIFGSHRRAFIEGDVGFISHMYSYVWQQGGKNTFYSYMHQIDPKPDYDRHIEFFNTLAPYHIENNICFVHGGWNYGLFNNVLEQFQVDQSELWWNRTLYPRAIHLQNLLDKGYEMKESTYKFGSYDKIFIGHTQTMDNEGDKSYELHKVCNIINIDTWGGWDGKVTGYILETDEYYSSDMATILYPNTINTR